MKIIFFQVYKKTVFPQFFKNASNSIDIALTKIVYIDKGIILIHNDRNIKFFGKNPVDIALKIG